MIDYTAATLDKSFAVYREGDRDQAYDLSVAAYLEGFELVESSLDNVDADLRRSTEKQLMAYRQALRDGLPEIQVAQQLELAKGKLAEAAKQLGGDSLSFSISFVSALLILLREGVEAILVLAAILAFLRNTGQESAVRGVHVGWGLAFVAGFATWALAAYVIDIGGAQRELMEGFTSLFACVMVLWLGVWMHDRRHAAAWQDYIRSSLVGGGGRFGFAVLAFFSVYRELFEVILFYETLWLQAGPAGHNAVIGGAATAVVLLIGLAWVILRGSAKLPLGLFFSINAALLCALSVVFAGHGVIALQEAGVIGTRPVPFFDFDWLGIKLTPIRCRPRPWQWWPSRCSTDVAGSSSAGVRRPTAPTERVRATTTASAILAVVISTEVRSCVSGSMPTPAPRRPRNWSASSPSSASWKSGWSPASRRSSRRSPACVWWWWKAGWMRLTITWWSRPSRATWRSAATYRWPIG